MGGEKRRGGGEIWEEREGGRERKGVFNCFSSSGVKSLHVIP